MSEKKLWKLYDIGGTLLMELHCKYDVIDFSIEEFNALDIQMNFEAKEACILRYGSDEYGDTEECDCDE